MINPAALSPVALTVRHLGALHAADGMSLEPHIAQVKDGRQHPEDGLLLRA